MPRRRDFGLKHNVIQFYFKQMLFVGPKMQIRRRCLVLFFSPPSRCFLTLPNCRRCRAFIDVNYYTYFYTVNTGLTRCRTSALLLTVVFQYARLYFCVHIHYSKPIIVHFCLQVIVISSYIANRVEM